jgi:hypothetical protein
VEQLLRRERGAFSNALRDAGVSEQEEREISQQIAAAGAAGVAPPPAARAVAVGERAPAFEYTDLGGRSARWEWPASAAVVRVVFFWGWLSLSSIEEMTWLEELYRRGKDIGLEVVAVEGSGLDTGAIQEALAKYRRYNPAPSFPLVADFGSKIGHLFGTGERLPQTFIMNAEGTVLHRADLFNKAEAAWLAGKVEKAFTLAGRTLPAPRGEAAEADRPPGGVEEAPSIRQKREQEEKFRSNLIQGDSAFMNWEFERALSCYLAALEVQPKDLHALVRTAQIYERRGDPANALVFWERVLSVRPDRKSVV